MIVEKSFDVISKYILDGHIVCLPTDTLYGFVCSANNAEAVERLYRLKKRPSDKACPVFFDSMHSAERYVKFDSLSYKIAQKFWPGSITIILENLKDEYYSNNPGFFYKSADTIAVRIPNVSRIIDLIRSIKTPLINTSANISGYPNSKSFDEIYAQLRSVFGSALDIVYYWDISCDGMSFAPSTMIECIGNKVELLREGVVKMSEIVQLLS